MSAYSRLKEAADHVITWVTIFGILAAALAWLSSKLTLMKGFGLADFVFVGALTAAAITLALAAILAAWRYFNPLNSKQANGASKSERPKSYLNTDADLEDVLRTEIKTLDSRFFKQLGDVNTSLTTLIQSFGADLNVKIAANDAARDVRFRNLEDAYLGQIARLREETKPFVERGKFANLDLLYLLDWALVRTETMLVLPDLLTAKPNFDLSTPPLEASDRKQLQDEIQGWIGSVVSVLQYLPLGEEINRTVLPADELAEKTLRTMVERPANIDPFELRDLYLLGYRCNALESLLTEMREKVKNDTLSTLSTLKKRAAARRT